MNDRNTSGEGNGESSLLGDLSKNLASPVADGIDVLQKKSIPKSNPETTVKDNFPSDIQEAIDAKIGAMFFEHRNSIEAKRRGHQYSALYFALNYSLSHIHLALLSPSLLSFMPDITGMIRYMTLKGADPVSSNAYFFYAILLGPIALAAWVQYRNSGKHRVPAPELRHSIVGFVFLVPCVLFILYSGVPSRSTSRQFNSSILSAMIQSDFWYWLYVSTMIWSLGLLTVLAFVYPCTKAASVYKFITR